MTKSKVTIKDVDKIWGKVGPRDGYLSLPIPHPLSFQLGRDHLGHRCFAVVNLRQGFKVDSSKSMSVKCEQTSGGKWTLLFVLEDKKLSEIFVKFCWDLIECSREAVDPESVLLLQYKKWRRMFAKLSYEAMSDQMQKGLLGELIYLRKLIDDIGEQAAVTAWQGAEGCDQDFEFETGWAEVKTVKISATEVTISSLQQLERMDVGKLIVYFADRDGSESETTISVKDIASEILRVLANPFCRDLFECKLARTGYFVGDFEFYKYRVDRQVVFCVNKDFPRLIRENVSNEIVDVKYAISLSSIQHFAIEE